MAFSPLFWPNFLRGLVGELNPSNVRIVDIIGRRIRQARLEKTLTQEQLGKMIGYTEETIANYERGRRLVSLDDLGKIAAVLQKPITFFIGTDPEPPSSKSPDLFIELLSRPLCEILQVQAIPIWNDTGGYLVLPRQFRGTGVFKVSEDLVNLGLTKGSFVLFDADAEPTPGSIVIVICNGAPCVRILLNEDKGEFLLNTTFIGVRTTINRVRKSEIIGTATWVFSESHAKYTSKLNWKAAEKGPGYQVIPEAWEHLTAGAINSGITLEEFEEFINSKRKGPRNSS